MSSKRTIAWTIWIVASIFYAYQYILRVMPNILLDDIVMRFHINSAIFGQFSGFYYIGYSLMHLPIGIMLDRFGPKKVMPACILLTVIGLLPLVYTDYWAYPIAGRCLTGIGSSAAILGVFKIIRMGFNEARFPRMLSISVTIGLMGAIYGGGPLSYMRETLGYLTVIKIFAILGLILAGITYWIIPNEKIAQQNAIASDLKKVLTNGRVIWSCILAGLMVGPLEGFSDVWGRAFLKEVYGFKGEIAASLPSMIFIGMCFGAPLLSLIAEKIGNYLIAIIGAGIIMTASFSLLLLWQLTPGAISFCFVLVGICCAYQIIAIYKISTYVPAQVSGLTTSIANMIIMIFGYAFHTAMGETINVMGGPHDATALLYGMLVIPVALCIATIGFIYLFVKERSRAEFGQLLEEEKG